MINRRRITLNGTEIIEESFRNITWDKVKIKRNQELFRTDFWALKDLTMSQTKKDYRQFLRDLPQNFTEADSAADAWNEYEIPERKYDSKTESRKDSSP